MSLNKDYEKIGYDIIGCAFEVRKTAGKNFVEKYYRDALCWELQQRGYTVVRELPIKVTYKGVEIATPYFADLVVDNKVVIELKALRQFKEAELRQIVSYLKLTDIKLGYLINFGVENFATGNLAKEAFPYVKGIYRVVNDIE